MSSSNDLQGLFSELLQELEINHPIKKQPEDKPFLLAPAPIKPTLAPKQNKEDIHFQCPIKASWINVGDYSPGVATDKNHKDGHAGIDLSAPEGTAIYPLAAGIVTQAGSSGKGGMNINIQHSNGVRSYYAHLASVDVKQGDRVDLNTVIGSVGSSGNAKGRGAHLHFQVWKDGSLQNPGQYFNVPAYNKKPTSPVKENDWLAEQARKFKISNINYDIVKLCNDYYLQCLND